MSDTLQPARQMDQGHPDADQLTAFAEHALPLHEREQTLAHLATCADCRQVVFVAQQAVEEDAIAAEPVRVRKPWLSGWNLVWTAALAVAGIAGFSVSMRNFAKPARNADAVARVAIEPERPPVPAAPPLVEAVAPKPLATPAAKKEDKAAPVAGGVGGVIANGRGVSLGEEKVQQSDEQAQIKTAPAAGYMGTNANGAGVGVAAAPKPVAAAAPPLVNRRSAFSGPMAQQVPQAPSQSQMATGQAVVNAEAPQRPALSAMAAAPLAAPRPAPPPPSPATAATAAAPNVGSVNQTVTVESASAADAVLLDGTALEKATIENRSIAPLVALPSHLPASSTVAHGPVTLALDSAGALFMSKDQERHWKRVKAQWDGHVKELSVVQPSPQVTGLLGKMRGPGQVFKLTTDAGAIWISADGQHWTRQ